MKAEGQTAALAQRSLWVTAAKTTPAAAGAAFVVWFAALALLEVEAAAIVLLLVALGFGLIALAVGSASWLVLRRREAIAPARKAGIGAVLGLAFLLAFGLIMPALAATERKAMISNCQTNQKVVAMLLCGHSEAAGRFPAASNWMGWLRHESGLPPKVLGCPFDTNNACAFAFNARLGGLAFTNVARNAVLLFETRPGGVTFGGPESAHPHSHSGKEIGVVLVDGSWRRVPTNKLSSLRWDP